MNLLLKISTAINYKRIGIIVVVRKNDDLDISYYQMSKSGNSVDICFSQTGLKSFADIDYRIKKYPVILTIHGAGIVQRVLPENYSDIKQSIPNINQDDYLIELEGSQDENKLLALYRKDQIESILGVPQVNFIAVHDISLGFIHVCKYLHLFSKDTNSFEIAGNNLVLFENRIKAVQKNNHSGTSEYIFAGMNRNASEITALSAGLNYFTNRSWNTFNLSKIEERIREFTASKISNFILYYFGAALFILLLINLLIFDSYQKQHESLEVESGDVVMLQNEINQLQSELNAKKQFILQNDVPENFAYAFYADRIAAFVDQGVELSELAICPIVGKPKEDKIITFQSKVLKIKGIAPNSTSYSAFLENIKNSHWAKKLNKQVYMYNKETQESDFEIEIELNHAID